MEAKDKILREGLAHEERIETAANEPVWEYADWLLATFGRPSSRGGDQSKGPRGLLPEYVKQSRYSQHWLNEMRRTAGAFPPDVRVPGVTLKVHSAQLSKQGSADKALEAIRGGATKTRDARPHESAAAVGAALAALPPSKRQQVLAKADPDDVGKALAKSKPEQRKKGLEALADEIDEEGRDEMLSAAINAVERPKKRKTPRPAQVWSAILSHIGNARRGMQAGLKQLQKQPELPEEAAKKLADEARKVRDSADLLIAYCEQGGPTMVDDIEAFLAEMASKDNE